MRLQQRQGGLPLPDQSLLSAEADVRPQGGSPGLNPSRTRAAYFAVLRKARSSIRNAIASLTYIGCLMMDDAFARPGAGWKLHIGEGLGVMAP